MLPILSRLVLEVTKFMPRRLVLDACIMFDDARDWWDRNDVYDWSRSLRCLDCWRVDCFSSWLARGVARKNASSSSSLAESESSSFPW